MKQLLRPPEVVEVDRNIAHSLLSQSTFSARLGPDVSVLRVVHRTNTVIVLKHDFDLELASTGEYWRRRSRRRQNRFELQVFAFVFLRGGGGRHVGSAIGCGNFFKTSAKQTEAITYPVKLNSTKAKILSSDCNSTTPIRLRSYKVF